MLSQVNINVEKGIDGMNKEAKATDKYVSPYKGMHPESYFDAREKEGK